ncbi:MAG: hypothetical protein R2932_25840 [Caldilineaceae bacterium]
MVVAPVTLHSRPTVAIPKQSAQRRAGNNRLYLHIFDWPFRHVHLAGLGDRVEYAQLLNDASEVKVVSSSNRAFERTMGGLQPNTLTLELPVQKPLVSVPVIELFLKD